MMRGNGDTDVNLWIEHNLKKRNGSGNNDHGWCAIFASTLWNLWKARNEYQFNDNNIPPDQVAFKSVDHANEILYAVKNNLEGEIKDQSKLIKWCFPSAGSFKVNTDGSVDKVQSRKLRKAFEE